MICTICTYVKVKKQQQEIFDDVINIAKLHITIHQYTQINVHHTRTYQIINKYTFTYCRKIEA